MAFYDTTWYIGSVHYAAVTARPQNTAVAAGVVRRQFTVPAVNSERCFVAIVAGTTGNVTDATWVLTRGAKTTDGTVTWIEATGMSAVNGDAVNTPTWTVAKAIGTPTQGAVIKRANGASYWIASVAGTMGASEPAWPNDTAGTTQADGTTTWTCLGVVGNFPAWGAPHARLANAYATNWGAAGNKFWIADNHAETQATGITLNPPLSAGTITTTICVDRTAALPPVEANYNTGATISTTTAQNIDFSISGSALNPYFQGITFSAGTGASSAFIIFATTTMNYTFKDCTFILGTTSTSSTINIGPTSTPNTVRWDNCKVQFGATGQSLTVRNVNFEWRNTPSAIQGATLPTVLFFAASTNVANMVCRGVDFSAFSGQLIQNNPGITTPFVFEDCKFHASMTRYGTTATVGYAATPVVTVRCDSGATNYKATRDEYAGSQVTETSITRVGGATDGTTPTSIKIATNAQAAFLTPYRMLRLAAWNDVVGANRTVTVCGTINAASLPNNDELWMDVQYLGDTTSPKASFKSTSKTHPLAAAAAVASDGSTWNNAPTTGGTKTIFLTSGTTWTVPADWNNANNKIECIGGGGGAGSGGGGLDSGSGGGGGAYATISNVALTPSSSVPIVIGQGGTGGLTNQSSGTDGTATNFNSGQCIAAAGKLGNAGAGGALGGAAASCTPTAGAFSGGAGGSGTGSGSGGGGGGSGGPHGSGASGGAGTSGFFWSGAGGGAADGGTAGSGQTSGGGGAGGAAFDATAGGAGGIGATSGTTTVGGAGSHGSGGGGGGGSFSGTINASAGGVGGPGIGWTQTSNSAVAGPGGGGGGGSGAGTPGAAGAGADGGIYGSGGGGGGANSGVGFAKGGNGSNGIIVITYTTPVFTNFKLVATLTSPQPQMKGYVYASIRAAKASTVFYIDPQITLS